MRPRSSASARVFYPARDRAQLVAALRERLPRLQATLPVRRVVLFGSHARGRHTVASDVDLLIVYAGEPRDDAYALARRALGIRGLEPHVYAEGEYRTRATTIDRMIAGGIEILADG